MRGLFQQHVNSVDDGHFLRLRQLNKLRFVRIVDQICPSQYRLESCLEKYMPSGLGHIPKGVA